MSKLCHYLLLVLLLLVVNLAHRQNSRRALKGCSPIVYTALLESLSVHLTTINTQIVKSTSIDLTLRLKEMHPVCFSGGRKKMSDLTEV